MLSPGASRVLKMRQSSGRWFLGSQACWALRCEKMRSLARDLLLVAPRAADRRVVAAGVERLAQRLRLHDVGVARRAVVERVDAGRQRPRDWCGRSGRSRAPRAMRSRNAIISGTSTSCRCAAAGTECGSERTPCAPDAAGPTKSLPIEYIITGRSKLAATSRKISMLSDSSALRWLRLLRRSCSEAPAGKIAPEIRLRRRREQGARRSARNVNHRRALRVFEYDESDLSRVAVAKAEARPSRRRQKNYFMSATVLVWLRNDLRIADNPALARRAARAAARSSRCMSTRRRPGLRPRGGACALVAPPEPRHARPTALAQHRHPARDRPIRASLDAARLTPRRQRCSGTGATARPSGRRTRGIARELAAIGIASESFAGNVLVEPFDMRTGAGAPYAVYTPFWNALRQRDIALPLPTPPATAPIALAPASDTAYPPAWSRKLEPHWHIGEAAARQNSRISRSPSRTYPDGRDVPARAATSRLSPHLAHGEISARQVWHATSALAHRRAGTRRRGPKISDGTGLARFQHPPALPPRRHRQRADAAPLREARWRDAPADLGAWQRGETGIAIVDAGMRELWETGFMHNRVRMLTASLLAKNLLIDWRLGERWFWDCLVDADPANNPGNWQWVAGCGIDAAPYFRIFNPRPPGREIRPRRRLCPALGAASRARRSSTSRRRGARAAAQALPSTANTRRVPPRSQAFSTSAKAGKALIASGVIACLSLLA